MLRNILKFLQGFISPGLVSRVGPQSAEQPYRNDLDHHLSSGGLVAPSPRDIAYGMRTDFDPAKRLWAVLFLDGQITEAEFMEARHNPPPVEPVKGANPREYYSGEHPFNHPPKLQEEEPVDLEALVQWADENIPKGKMESIFDVVPEETRSMAEIYGADAPGEEPTQLTEAEEDAIDSQIAEQRLAELVDGRARAIPFEEIKEKLGFTDADPEPTADDILEEFSDRSDDRGPTTDYHVAGIPISEKKVVEVPASTQNSMNTRTARVSLRAEPDFTALARQSTTAKSPVRVQVRQAYRQWSEDPSSQNLEALLAIKRRIRRPWDQLGLSPTEIEAIGRFRSQ